MKIEEVESALASMSTILVHGERHVIRPMDRKGSSYPNANYLNTDQALVGVLRRTQSFDSFKAKWKKKRLSY